MFVFPDRSWARIQEHLDNSKTEAAPQGRFFRSQEARLRYIQVRVFWVFGRLMKFVSTWSHWSKQLRRVVGLTVRLRSEPTATVDDLTSRDSPQSAETELRSG